MTHLLRLVALLFVLPTIGLAHIGFNHPYSSTPQGDTRKIHWDAVPDAIGYFGNIYLPGSPIEDFYAEQPHIIVPLNASVEIYAVFGFKRLKKLILSHPNKEDFALGASSKGNANSNETSTQKEPKPTSETLDPTTEIIGYNGTPIQSPELDAISEDLFEEIHNKNVDPQKPAPKALSWNGDVGGGLIANQESLLSQGLIGVFDGLGTSYGVQLFMDFYPKKRTDSPMNFSLALELLQFSTSSETTVSGENPKTVESTNQTHRVRADAHIKSFVFEASYITLGLGASYDRLPFFELINESEGSGKLISRQSVGISGIMRFIKPLHLGELLSEVGVTPIGAGVKSMFQTDINVTLKSGIESSIGYYISLKSKYQKLRYPRECSVNDTETCVNPKTEGYSIGPVIGIYSDW